MHLHLTNTFPAHVAPRTHGTGKAFMRALPVTTTHPVWFVVLVWVLMTGGTRIGAEEETDDHGWLSGWEMSGYAELELRGFPHKPVAEEQFDGLDLSLAVEPEWTRYGASGNDMTRLRTFVRWDAQDEDRTHWDIREAYWQRSLGNWDLKFGVGKVFWGVTESNHLVDTINQTDGVEDIDLEAKLGQPMVHATWLTDSMGVFDLFYLPYFRVRTFPGPEGRLRFQPPLLQNHPQFESDLERWHPDFALRWSHIMGDFDLGLHYFYGTSRDPVPLFQTASNGDISLVPFYPLMHQVGMDLQWTYNSWLWKLEALKRESTGQSFEALVGGFEYTVNGVFSTAADLGFLVEYHFDSRWNQALSPFNHDVFAGLRTAWNDASDMNLLTGVFWDHVHHASSFRAEWQKRWGEQSTIALQAQWFIKNDPTDFAYAFRRDHHVTLEFRRWF